MLLLFIDQEEESSELFIHLLSNISSEVEVRWYKNMEDVDWLMDAKPDLIFVNVLQYRHLSFEIPCVLMADSIADWAEYSHLTPIFDKLLRPFQMSQLLKIFEKYHFYKRHFKVLNQNYCSEKRWKDRIIGKKGTNFHVILCKDISFIYTESKIVFAIDKDGNRFILEQSLSDLEMMLNPTNFFRVNRKFIVHILGIKSFKPSFKGKIALELEHLSKAEVSISQENAQQFRKWIEGLA